MIIDTSLRSTVAAEAEEMIGRVYRRSEVRDTGEAFLFRQRSRGDERANITRFQISSSAVAGVTLDGVVGIGQLHAGRYRATSNGEEIDPGAPFVLRPGEARSWSEEMDLTMVNLDLAALTEYARGAGVVASGPLRFDRVAAASPVSANNWRRMVAHATDTFRDADLLGNDLIRSSVVDVLYAAALAAFLGDPADDDASEGPIHPAAIKRALQFIDDNAGNAITAVDIAGAAGLSLRGLEAAFRRSLGTTPTARLREVRLDHAHADLSAADPSTTTVAAIAQRWGFAHLSRFARAHVEAYGALPSETLNG
nr:helix-turn-helix transcriptional regulator [Microbacterium lemovicicum]